MIYQFSQNISVVVVGDIHAHLDQFNQLIAKFPPSPECILISVGDLYDKGFGDHISEEITGQFMEWNRQGIGFVIKGNHELKRIKKAKEENNITPQLLWLESCPLSISFRFNNQSLLTVVHGGVLPGYTWNDLEDNSNLCYIRTIDEKGKYIPSIWIQENGNKKLVAKKPGKVWHELYDGRFGYIASGHDAQIDGKAKFYNYSCNLDSRCYDSGILTAIKVDENTKQIFEFFGPAKHKKC